MEENSKSEVSVNVKKGMEYVPGNTDKGNSDKITRAYLDSMLLVFRHVGAVEPISTTSILGQEFAMPLMASPMAMLDRIRPGGSAEFAEGVKRAGALMWTGWVGLDEMKAVGETGARTIYGIKPFQDNDKVLDAIEKAASWGAMGCFMDIDHCFNDCGKDCPFAFGQLSHKSEDELKTYIDTAHKANIAFIFKGIMSPEDAQVLKELGADGIVVSHHKGIWSYSAPPAMMLPEIRRAVGKEFPVFADCGVHNGVDAFKLLAAGAGAVGIARQLQLAFSKKGADGVYDRLMFLNDELLGTMAKTHCASPEEISSDVIRMRTGW